MKITRREAIDAIKGMFETNTGEADNASMLTEYENDTATFMLDKRKYERYEIIDKLSKFFDGVSIIDGQCRIDCITFVFTNVYIEDRPDKTKDGIQTSDIREDVCNLPKKKRSKMLSIFYALLLCLFYVALAIGTNILSHKLFGLYCGIDSITFSMVFTIVWVLCYIHITED